jgi:hypothetical protein
MGANTTLVSSALGLTAEELGLAAKGWSIKKNMLAMPVYNDNNDHLGMIDDLVVTRDKAICYAIIGVGGYLGLGSYDVAIPVHRLRMNKSQITLPGATTESLKAIPAFKYE